MKYIKDGKIILNGTYREYELKEMIFKAMEIIVDKNVDILLVKNSSKASYYNVHRDSNRKPLKGIEFKLLKEIGIVWEKTM